MAGTHSGYDCLRDECSRQGSLPQPPVPSKKPDDVSSLHWHAALGVYKLKDLKLAFTQNPVLSTNESKASTREASHAALARPQAITDRCDPFRHIRLFAPRFADSLFFKRLSSSTEDNWTLLKATLLADGYRVALLHAVVAILVDHIRRTFVPWLGTFWCYHPMDDLRLAMSNPAVSLEQTLSYPWYHVLYSVLQRLAIDAGAWSITATLLAMDGRQAGPASDRFRTSPKAVLATLRGLVHLGKMSLWMYMLITLDYVFCNGVHIVSCAIATYKLAAGTESDRLALEQLIETYTLRSTFIAWASYCYLWRAIRPTVIYAVKSTARGRPLLFTILLSVAGGVWAMLWYRARLYILLEMLPMFVAFGALALMVVLLTMEFVADPLGLKADLVIGRRRATEAKESGLKGGTMDNETANGTPLEVQYEQDAAGF